MSILSPMRVFVLAIIGAVAVLIYMTLHPRLSVTPLPASGSGAAFGTLFSLRNGGIAALHDLSSAYCVNSFHAPDNSEPAAAGNLQLGVPGQGVTLAALARKDAEALPIIDAPSGPPGSQVDLVFVVRFQPGWWMNRIERRFRFVGTENQDATWSWQEMPLGSPCG
jgi:hypothetical protein